MEQVKRQVKLINNWWLQVQYITATTAVYNDGGDGAIELGGNTAAAGTFTTLTGTTGH